MFNLHRVVVRAFGSSIYRINFCTVPKPFSASNSKTENEVLKAVDKPKNSLISAAFESLRTNEDQPLDSKVSSNVTNILSDRFDQRIDSAKTVSQLLSVADNNNGLKRKHALKIVSILAEWSSIDRAKLSDFVNDIRFVKLCRQLGRTTPKPKIGENPTNSKLNGFHMDDLNMVMSIASDDEAAKLISSISLPLMIKVMKTLASKQRRSTSLLRSLAYNISSNSERLNLKQCADLLYAMAVLNFPDSVLITRAGVDIHNGLAQNNDKPASVGSIITSLGLLKFRDSDLLESLTEWMIRKSDICRPQDVSSLFLTLASLNYPTTKSKELKATLVKAIASTDFAKPSDWLNHVWALVILDFADSQHFESVLGGEFIENLAIERAGDLSPPMKLKLLNINAAAKCLKPTYTGPVLATNSEIFSMKLENSKTKNLLVVALVDTLKNLFTSSNLIRTNFDTRMGFVIDAECVLDAKGNPLPVDKDHENGTRVAIMVRDYHDMCQGIHHQPTGLSALSHKLLEHAGYKIVTVPYNEFNATDKLLKRVQYLQGKLKLIIERNN